MLDPIYGAPRAADLSVRGERTQPAAQAPHAAETPVRRGKRRADGLPPLPPAMRRRPVAPAFEAPPPGVIARLALCASHEGSGSSSRSETLRLSAEAFGAALGADPGRIARQWRSLSPDRQASLRDEVLKKLPSLPLESRVFTYRDEYTRAVALHDVGERCRALSALKQAITSDLTDPAAPGVETKYFTLARAASRLDPAEVRFFQEALLTAAAALPTARRIAEYRVEGLHIALHCAPEDRPARYNTLRRHIASSLTTVPLSRSLETYRATQEAVRGVPAMEQGVFVDALLDAYTSLPKFVHKPPPFVSPASRFDSRDQRKALALVDNLQFVMSFSRTSRPKRLEQLAEHVTGVPDAHDRRELFDLLANEAARQSRSESTLSSATAILRGLARSCASIGDEAKSASDALRTIARTAAPLPFAEREKIMQIASGYVVHVPLEERGEAIDLVRETLWERASGGAPRSSTDRMDAALRLVHPFEYRSVRREPASAGAVFTGRTHISLHQALDVGTVQSELRAPNYLPELRNLRETADGRVVPAGPVRVANDGREARA